MAGGYEVGKAYVTIIPSAKGFTKGLGESVLPQTEETGKKAGGVFGSGMKSGFSKVTGVVAGVVSAVASRGIDVLSNSLNGAIKRVDTINNFPRVLTSLGYSADDAAKSVSKISDHISGLPTTLDSMTSSVQQILPSVKNVDKASDIMLAFNDALIAGGKGTEYQQAAIEQFSQALAKGVPEMQDWRSIEVAMPGQLDQVAKSLLGTTANSNDLYEALKSGSITMDDFTDKLVELDKNGANGFASFSDQARAAIGGIGVQINLIGTRIVKGVGNVINAIGADNFIRPLEAISAGVDTTFGKIIDIINKTKDVFAQLSQTDSFESLKSALASLHAAVENTFGTIIQTVKDYIIQITGVQNTGDFVKKASDIMSQAADGINKAADALNGITDWCRDHKSELEAAAISITTFVVAIKGLSAAATIISGIQAALAALSAGEAAGGFTGLIGLIVAHPVAAIIAAIAAAVAGLVYWFTQTDSGKKALQDILNIFQKVAAAVGGFFENIWPIIKGGLTIAWATLQGIAAVVFPILLDAWNQLVAAFQQPWVQNLIEGIKIVAALIGAAFAIFLENLPQIIQIVGILFTAIIAIVTDIVTFIAGVVATIISIVINIVAGIINIISGIIQFIINLIDFIGASVQAFGFGLAQYVAGIISGIINIVSGIINFFIGLGHTILGIVTGNFDLIKDGVGRMVDGIKQYFAGLADIISAPFKAAFAAIKHLWNSTIGGKGFTVPDWIPGIGGKDFKIPKLATGGTLTTGGTVMVGEAGPELLTLPRGARVTPLDAAGVGTAGGTTYNLAFGDVNLTDKAAAQQAAREFIEYLIRISS